MSDLKLIALDAEDLAVISAHLQDAVLQVGDMAYLPREQRFAAIVNRFDWSNGLHKAGKNPCYFRRRTGIHFERVLGARLHGIDLKDRDRVLELLALQFEVKDAPEGFVTLVFAGGGEISLHVECIEAELRDLGPAWQARAKPEHPDEEPSAAS
jgi:hypothetical protein